ncbi:hypothetical protein Q8F55_009217 [Vanrija albida]|uniref:F-box domain-containing protein n=1 Tax=Vanrija albida TaxID=181172 RepID=A0ABR3PT15_9TREE
MSRPPPPKSLWLPRRLQAQEPAREQSTRAPPAAGELVQHGGRKPAPGALKSLWLPRKLGQLEVSPPIRGPSTPSPPVADELVHQPGTPTTPAALDHSAFPHIFDAIVNYASVPSLAVLRATSREMHRRCTPRMYAHIWARAHLDEAGRWAVELCVPGSAAGGISSSGTRIPGLKYYTTASNEDIRETLRRIRGHTRVVDMDISDPFSIGVLAAAGLMQLFAGGKVLRRLDMDPLQVPHPAIGEVAMAKMSALPGLRAATEVAHFDLGAALENGSSLLPDWDLVMAFPAATRTAVLFVDIPRRKDSMRTMSYRHVPLLVPKMRINLAIVLYRPSWRYPIVSTSRNTMRFLLVLILHMTPDVLQGPRQVCPWASISIGPIEAFDDKPFDSNDSEDKARELGDRLRKLAAKAMVPSELNQEVISAVRFVSLAELQELVGAEEWEMVRTPPRPRLLG